MDYKNIISEVVEAARLAGKAILEIYERSEGIEIERKADNSPLTIADKAANTIICERLAHASLQFPIISEENKAIPYEIRKDYDYYWLVDPLDGTKEFIKRNGEFTVNIALIHRQMPVMGVVYTPCTGEMYWAVKGEGAFMEVNGRSTPLAIDSFKLSDENLRLVCSRSHLNEATQTFVNQFASPQLVSRGSSLKFLIIARGEAHIYPRLAPTMEWDTGAAQIILEEAGGRVIEEQSKEALKYNKKNLLNPHFVAYGRTNLSTDFGSGNHL